VGHDKSDKDVPAVPGVSSDGTWPLLLYFTASTLTAAMDSDYRSLRKHFIEGVLQMAPFHVQIGGSLVT
jgi:hypothetical protein